MRLFLSLVLILALSGTRAHPTPSPKTGPETGPEPGSEECRRLIAPLSLEDKTPVLGRFHFLLGFTDHEFYRTVLNLTSNFWYNVTETKTGIRMNHFSKMNGTCVKTGADITVNGHVAKAELHNITSEFHFVPLGDSVILDIRAFSADVRDFVQKLHMDSSRFSPELRVHSFYLMSRSTDVSDADLQLFRDYARCAGFRGDLDYQQQSKEYCSEEESILTVF